MANNRMVLVCNVCYPKKGEWAYHTPGVFVLAKTLLQGYYTANGFSEDKLNKWFSDHVHDYSDLLFRMEYESDLK